MLMLCLFLYTFGLVITFGAVAMAAWNDMRAFRIPNMISGLVVLGFVLAYTGAYLVPGATVPLFQPLLSHVLAAGVMFALTLVLFAVGSIGAGDAKFASALALWVGVTALPLYIFYMSLVGGLMGIFTLLLKRWKPFRTVREGTWVASAQAGMNRIPYGLAIAIGFFIAVSVLGYLNITEITNVVENGE